MEGLSLVIFLIGLNKPNTGKDDGETICSKHLLWTQQGTNFSQDTILYGKIFNVSKSWGNIIYHIYFTFIFTELK